MTTVKEVYADNILGESHTIQLGDRVVVNAHRPACEDYVRGCYMGGSPEDDEYQYFDTLEEAADYITTLKHRNDVKNASREKYEIANWEWEVEITYGHSRLYELEYAVQAKVESLAAMSWGRHLEAQAEVARLEQEKKDQDAVKAAAEEKKRRLKLYEDLQKEFGDVYDYGDAQIGGD